jgi:DNA-directed RNA polymerase specialized sigma24 family protein
MRADDHTGPTDRGSVSRLIPALKEGDRAAVQALWERFFEPLVRVAAGRVPGRLRRQAGPEDIAVEAFLDFCACLARPDAGQRFPLLNDREYLWKLLVCFTLRAAFDFNRKAGRRQRVVAGESALGERGLAGLVGREPGPEFAAAVAALLDRLPDDTLRQVALRKMEGYTHDEIARQMDCSVKTVERKARVIRRIWAPPEDQS